MFELRNCLGGAVVAFLAGAALFRSTTAGVLCAAVPLYFGWRSWRYWDGH